jgi:hypothetical protein
MRLKKTIAAKILVVFLIYVFMAGNTSGELVLCINAAGYITLEPLNHEHSKKHAHFEYNKQSPLGHEHDRHVDHSHCRPCIDIPIFIGPTDNRLQLKQVKPNQQILTSLSETEALTNDSFMVQAVPLRIFSATDQNRFLRSVILLV